MPLKMRPPTLATPDRSIARVPQYSDVPKPTKDFYGSAAWKTLRAAVIRERGRTCESCGRTDGRPFVDHVVEMNDGGAALDRSNLQVLCGSCHTRKTAAVRAARAARGGR